MSLIDYTLSKEENSSDLDENVVTGWFGFVGKYMLKDQTRREVIEKTLPKTKITSLRMVACVQCGQEPGECDCIASYNNLKREAHKPTDAIIKENKKSNKQLNDSQLQEIEIPQTFTSLVEDNSTSDIPTPIQPTEDKDGNKNLSESIHEVIVHEEPKKHLELEPQNVFIPILDDETIFLPITITSEFNKKIDDLQITKLHDFMKETGKLSKFLLDIGNPSSSKSIEDEEDQDGDEDSMSVIHQYNAIDLLKMAKNKK